MNGLWENGDYFVTCSMRASMSSHFQVFELKNKNQMFKKMRSRYYLTKILFLFYIFCFVSVVTKALFIHIFNRILLQQILTKYKNKERKKRLLSVSHLSSPALSFIQMNRSFAVRLILLVFSFSSSYQS